MLPMPDIRNFLKCNKYLNKINLATYEEKFLIEIRDKLYMHRCLITKIDQLILEYMYYGYAKLLPVNLHVFG